MLFSYNIGDEWECPRCGAKVMIIESGLEHGCSNNYIRYTPEDLRAIREFTQREEKLYWYGETEIN